MSERITQIKTEVKTLRREISKVKKQLKPLTDAEEALCIEWAEIKYGIHLGDMVESTGCFQRGKRGKVVAIKPYGLYKPSYEVLFEGASRPEKYCSQLKKVEAK